MKRFLAILFLAVCLPAFGATINTYTLTVTNLPLGGSGTNITANAVTRAWTNATTSSTILTNLGGLAHATTNLANAYGIYFQSGVTVTWITTNSLRFRGSDLVLSSAGNWCSITTNIAATTNLYTLLLPEYNMSSRAAVTNDADFVVGYIPYARTNVLAETVAALSNFVGKTASVTLGNKTLTNSYVLGGTSSDHVSTNLINKGNAFRSDGAGAASLQIGSNALASSASSVAIGVGALATNTDTIAMGTSARATNQYGTAVGSGAFAYGPSATVIGRSASGNETSVALGAVANASGTNGVALGNNSEATGPNTVTAGASGQASSRDAIAIGYLSAAIHSNSVAIGATATTTASNEIRLGISVHAVRSPGVFEGNTYSNSIAKGTNTFNGDLAFTPRINGALANGNNSGVLLGTNIYLRLMGPSAAYTNAGFVAEREGSFHILQLTNPAINMSVMNDSGLEATPANRILTGTGADMNFTNNPVHLQILYDAAASRWRLLNWTR